MDDSVFPPRLGPYRMEGLLGSGGMGQVYRAYDDRLGRPLAIKHILVSRSSDEIQRRRFRREARAIALLNHPAIVQVYDFIETEEGDWLVMELIEGENLRSLLSRGALPPAQGIALALEIAGGLGAAHDQGLVHRDLKTENVMVTPEGRAKILDFGLAKKFHPNPNESALSVEGAILGTIRAMSPEQAMGFPLDHRSDLFSLGTLLYETLTGESPFLRGNPAQTLTRVCNFQQRPAWKLNPGLPREVSNFIDQLLEKAPDHRPGNAALVAHRLGELLQGLDAAQAPDKNTATLATDTLATNTPATNTLATLIGETGGRPSLTSPVRSSGPASGERRQITVMSCELVAGSSSQLEPEVLYEVLADFEALANTVLARYEGYLGNSFGHHLVIYFGYPKAHENDAHRAVHTALELISEVESLNARRARGETVALRLGIHTGLGVTPPTPGSPLALGQTLDLATGIGIVAEPNQVVVSPETLPLITDFFLTATLPPIRLAGILQPLTVHRVLAPRDLHSPEAQERRLPLVGRSVELAQLLECFRRARCGSGQVVLLSGEAGVGKTRLVAALEEGLARDEKLWLNLSGSSLARNSPFTPLIELLRQVLAVDPHAPEAQQMRQLEAAPMPVGLQRQEAVALLASLFSLPERSPLPFSPQKRREKILQAAAEVLLKGSRSPCLVLVVEDLHWIDPSTLELVGLLIERAPSLPLLLLLTSRPSFQPPWDTAAEPTEILLERLDDEQVARLLDHLATDLVLPQLSRQHIAARSDGIPLFVEELTRAVLEAGFEVAGQDEGTVPNLEIPRLLRNSLTARLDHLGAAKEVARLAAVCGREFPYRLLAAVAPMGEADLERQLARLVSAAVLQKEGAAGYTFRHALLKEAALESLLDSQRRFYHQRVAAALEELFPEVVEQRPEQLGYHWREAGEAHRARPYLWRAGDRSRDAWANAEALALYRQTLSLLEVAGQEVASESSSKAREDSLRLHEQIGDLETLARRFDTARTAYAVAAARTKTPLENARLHRKIGQVWETERLRDEALRALAMADAALGPPSEAAPEAWWEEWIQIRLEQIMVHYFQGELDKMNPLVERLKPAVWKHSTASQRAAFLNCLLACNTRRERFCLSSETLELARAVVDATEEMGDLEKIADAKFDLFFVLLFQNTLDEALTVLQATLKLAQRIGATTVETTSRAYQPLLYRKRGEVREAARLSTAIVDGESPVRQPEYVGLAAANLAWVAWRMGDAPAVEQHGAMALERWRQSTISYPLQWTALWPLLAARLERGDLGAAVESARRMLSPSQARLGEPLTKILTTCTARFEEDTEQKTRHRLAESIRMARDLLYL